jgi:hypothetical protein
LLQEPENQPGNETENSQQTNVQRNDEVEDGNGDDSNSLESESNYTLGSGGKVNKKLEKASNKSSKRPRMDTITEAVRELKDLNKILSVPDQNVRKVEDECDVIGRHIAMQLRELPIQDRIMANVDIQQVLMKYRLQNIYRRSETTRSHTSTSSAMTFSSGVSPDSAMSNQSGHNEPDLGLGENLVSQTLKYAGLEYNKDDRDDDLH